MKRFTKACLFICIVLICISAVCLGAGAALGSGFKEVKEMADNGEFDFGGWHIGRWGFYFNSDEEEGADDAGSIVKKSFDADEIKNLDIDIKYGKVYVTDSGTDKIEIKVDAPRSHSYRCKKSGKTLELIDKTSRHMWNFGNAGNVEVEIAIPEGKEFNEADLITNAGKIEITHCLSAEEVVLEVDAGELTAGEILAAGDFSVDVGAGSINVSRFSAKSLEADCGVGEIKLCGTVLKKAEADCGVGQITLDLNGREEDYDYEISCGLGTVRINEKSYSTLSVEKEIDNDAGNTINLECGVGEIRVNIEEE